MKYGEIKTDFYSKMEKDSDDYYHYEVVTRWQPAYTRSGTEWEHLIFKFQKDGTKLEYKEWAVYLKIDYLDRRMSNFVQYETHHVSVMGKMNEQHSEIVRCFLG